LEHYRRVNIAKCSIAPEDEFARAFGVLSEII